MREALKFGISHKLLYRKEMEISTVFIYEGPKIYHGMILVFRDISEKQKLQLIANRNDRMKELGQMAATVAHEIRNPLGAVSHAAQLLAESPDLPETDRRLTRIICDHSRRMNTVVENVLRLSRREPAPLQELPLTPLLEELAEDPSFVAFCEAEFPSVAPQLDRRRFLQLMGASLAFSSRAGFASLARRGAWLVFLGYLLNLLRGTIPAILGLRFGFVTADEIADPRPAIEAAHARAFAPLGKPQGDLPAMRERLARLNPTASARVAHRLIEASERQYWKPEAHVLEALRRAGEELEDRLEGIYEGASA
mgnify:CR=1 FL=1